MKKRISFTDTVNWEWVNANTPSNEKFRKGDESSPWMQKIIKSAIENGYKGKITPLGARRVCNKNLWK